MFPDIPVFWSWVSLAIKMQAWGAAGTLVLAGLFFGIRFVWPLLRWLSVGLTAYQAVSDVRDSFRSSEEN